MDADWLTRFADVLAPTQFARDWVHYTRLPQSPPPPLWQIMHFSFVSIYSNKMIRGNWRLRVLGEFSATNTNFPRAPLFKHRFVADSFR